MDKNHKKLIGFFSPIEKINSLAKKHKIISGVLIILPISVCIYSLLGILVTALLDAMILVLFYFFKIYDYGSRHSIASIIMSALISFVFVYEFCNGDINGLNYINKINMVLLAVCFYLFVFSVIGFILSLINRFLLREKDSFCLSKKLMLPALALIATLEIYLPVDTYINNLEDFDFKLPAFVPALILKVLFLALVSVYFAFILKPKAIEVLSPLIVGITLGCFAQYTFMNSKLGVLIGSEPDWDKDIPFEIINAVIWIALIALPFIIGAIFKKHKDKILVFSSAFISAVQLLSAVLAVLFVQGNIYSYETVMADGSVQYDVASGKNIVTFVFDAADNMYFNELLENEPEAFEGLEDFTLYNNTCSVYNFTFCSVNQMMTGAESYPTADHNEWFDTIWHSEKTAIFYDRLHSADYTVNGFIDADVSWENVKTHYDNTDYSMEPYYIDSLGIVKRLENLSMYRYMPFCLKRFVDVTDVQFDTFVFFKNNFYFFDDDYASHLQLKKREDWKNCFIFEHLFGTHQPCPDTIAETKNCLNIVKEYIRQLKELGVYDDATIIVTADHGYHTEDYSKGASTPIFMIKEPGNHSDKMKISNAPIYHRDLLSTYLINAGLYTENDREIFGSSIYDFDENSERERIWNKFKYITEDDFKKYGKQEEGYSYIVYKYIGDADELGRVINDEGPSEVLHER